MKTFTKSFPAVILLFLVSNLINAQSWSLTGNAGTSPGTNFIGTTDVKALYFKVGDLNSGYLDSTKTMTSFGFRSLFNITGNYCSAFGYGALSANTTGISNTAIGYKALNVNTTGLTNTAVGAQSLYSNTQGKGNTAVGNVAMITNTSGNFNTANGSSALFSNTSGSNNTTSGYESMRLNTIGNYNTASGVFALRNNTDGNNNVAIGYNSLRFNQSSGNTAVGANALQKNSTGGSNCALGSSAMWQNTTGFSNVAVGNQAMNGNTFGNGNTVMGEGALMQNTGGNYTVAIGIDALGSTLESYNTGVGSYAMYYNTYGSANTVLGYRALYNNQTGTHNTAVGYNAGDAVHNTTYCTLLGDNSDANGDFNSSTAIGYNSRITADYQVRIGNSSTSSIGGYVAWTDLPSDGRFKKDIKENVPGLKFINQLRAVTYTMDVTKLRQFMGEDNKEISSAEKAISEKEKMLRTGFIAQEVEAAAKKIGYDFSGVDKPQNENSIYGLRYSEFVVPLVKAVQELSNQNDELKERLAKLETLINAQLTEPGEQSAISNKLSVLSGASLQQNIPNPFNRSTTINYTLPQQYTAAKIILTDNAGKQLKEVNISGSGKGTLKIDTSTLGAGTYNYSLYVNGNLIGSKQMILAK